MKRLLFWCVLLVVLGTGFFISYSSRQTGIPERIIFVTIDTLRYDHVSAYGYIRKTTPFLDMLADQGVLFENAQSASSHTAPSHASFFTSLYPFQHQVKQNHDVLSPQIFNVVQMTQEAGYEVMGFSAVEFLREKMGFPRPEPEPKEMQMRRLWFLNAKTQVNRVMHWMDTLRRDKRKKFFIWLHLYDVHQWSNTQHLPPSYWKAMRNAPDQQQVYAFVTEQHGIPLDFHKTEKDLMQAMNGYDARLRFVDDQLARLQEYFKKEGLDRGLLWIVSSDHGEGLGNHGYDKHGKYIYQEQLHIPLIMSYTDGRFAGKRVPNLVRSVDFLPTLADIIQVKLPDGKPAFQGRSLYPFMTGEQPVLQNSQLAFAERAPKSSTSRSKLWAEGSVEAMLSLDEKIIYGSEGEVLEYYDLREDPLELNNLGADEHSTEKRRMLYERLRSLRDHSDQLPEGAGEVEMTEENLEELRSLGYL